MGRSRWTLALLLVSGCKAELGGIDPDGGGGGIDSATPGDGANSPDAPVMLGAWGTPTKFPGAGTAANEDDGSLSANGKEMVFAIADPADGNNKDLYYTTKQMGQWTTPVKLAVSLTGSSEETPRFSADDLTLYFASGRAGGQGNLDIYKITRGTMTSTTWSAPVAVVGPNSAALEKWFMPCAADTSYLVIQGGDLAEGTIGGAAPAVSTILSSTTANETGSFLSSDCLTAYYTSARVTPTRMFKATRTSRTSAWSAPVQVDDFTALGGDQEDPWISNDQRTFVFVSNVGGTKDVYISTR